MTVNSYTFHSPSAQQIQVGERVPQQEETQNKNSEQTSTDSPNVSSQSKDFTQSSTAIPTATTTNPSEDVSGALTGFSTLNNQAQAVDAYSS